MSTDGCLGRVMLIDDEEFDIKVYRRILDRSGMAAEVIAFNMAPDALEYLRDDTKPPVDLILLDIRMPCMDGFEFLDAAQRYLGQDFSVPVVIMLTTSLSPEDAAKAEERPSIRGYFNKPLVADLLEELVTIVDASRRAA